MDERLVKLKILKHLEDHNNLDPAKFKASLMRLCDELGLGVANYVTIKHEKLEGADFKLIDKKKLSEAIDRCDKDGNGRLSVGEVIQGLKHEHGLVDALNTIMPNLHLSPAKKEAKSK